MPSAEAVTLLAIEAVTGLTSPQLRHMALWADRNHRRELRAIGERNRLLHVPAGRLLIVQRAIADELLTKLPISPWVFGCPGRGPRDNAAAHMGNRFVQLVDLRDAFPSTSHHQVRQALLDAGFDAEAAGLVTCLCTAGGQLPQGAATSNALLNLVLAPIDWEFGARARESGLIYTRYVDDISVSGNIPVSGFVAALERQLRRRGFLVNPHKRRNWVPGSRPIITGVVLAGSLRPRKDFLRDLSSEVRLFARGRSKYSMEQLQSRIAWVKQLDDKMARHFSLRIGPGGRHRTAAARRHQLRRASQSHS